MTTVLTMTTVTCRGRRRGPEEGSAPLLHLGSCEPGPPHRASSCDILWPSGLSCRNRHTHHRAPPGSCVPPCLAASILVAATVPATMMSFRAGSGPILGLHAGHPLLLREEQTITGLPGRGRLHALFNGAQVADGFLDREEVEVEQCLCNTPATPGLTVVTSDSPLVS
jgi:hypothetical protein